MAINKVVNKSTKSHGAMRNVLEYVLRDEKVKEGYVEISGPYSGDSINYDDIYKSWLDEKKLWDKDSGRMYTHNIISFHKDEQITPEQVLEISKEFAERFFPGHQYVIGVHQDKEHLHGHIVANTVSYIDGLKLHQTKRDLERQKEFTNDLCLERGLSIAEKGRHFDGSTIEEGEITAWSKDKYNLLLNDSKKSFVAECAIAIMDVVPKSTSREEFISGMEEKGWSVQWEDSRKHIVFQNEEGNKVRDTNIEKTFAGLVVNKEALTHEFERQNEQLRDERECSEYYAEVESALAGADVALENYRVGRSVDESELDNRGDEEEEFHSFVRKHTAKEDAGRESVEASVRDADLAEQDSVNRQTERRLAELARLADNERRRKLEKENSVSRGFSR